MIASTGTESQLTHYYNVLYCTINCNWLLNTLINSLNLILKFIEVKSPLLGSPTLKIKDFRQLFDMISNLNGYRNKDTGSPH